MRRIRRVKQHDLSDCGAACLASVVAYYGGRAPIAAIRRLAGTDTHGTSVLGLVDAASRLGLTAKGVRAAAASLGAVPLPAIAHVVEGPRTHFVVVYRASADRVTVMDPADGHVHRHRLSAFAERWSGVLVLLAPAPGATLRSASASPTARLWQLMGPHRAALLHALVGALAGTVLALAPSIYVQKVIDGVLADGDLALLDALGAALLAALAAQCAIGVLRTVMTLRVGERIDAQLVLGYYQHLLALPQSFFDTMRVGELVARLADAVKIRTFVTEVAVELVSNACLVAAALALLATYSWRLALVVGAVVPAYALLGVLVTAVSRGRLRRLAQHSAELYARLVESLGGVSTLRRVGGQAAAVAAVEHRLTSVMRHAYRAAMPALVASVTSQAVGRVATVALFAVGARLVLRQALTTGQLMSCYTLLGYLTGPLAGLVGASRGLQDALVAVDRLFEILDLEREDATGLSLAAAPAGDVEFEDVSFRYGTRQHALRGLSARIRRGRVTAVVGESGSGKSTLLALLQRVYAPSAGRIRVGEHDLAHLAPATLRALVGTVPQRIDLFSGTLLENVTLGDAAPDAERAVRAAAAAGLDGVARELPRGYATTLGEHGADLSGGQRQRLAIARALYGDPEILALDEATAALDAHTERRVLSVIDDLRTRGRTVVLVVHRLPTARRADHILVLHAGALAEEGTHAELLAARGRYWALWRDQMGGGE